MAALEPQRAHALGRVAVVFGGHSAERVISLKSGQAVLAGLQRAGVDAHAVDPAESGLTPFVEGQFDRAWLALHGRGGEDGSIQGALASLGVPYTGSGVLGSALAMDKWRSKQLWRGSGVPTAAFARVTQAVELADAAEEVGFPMIVKPAHEGSSIGMSRVHNARELERAWRTAADYDAEVLLERWIHGQEYTAAILDDQVLPIIRLETPREFYDYAAKYEAGTTGYHCPCGLGADRERQLGELCRRAFADLGASGWGRVDFMLDDSDQPWFLEVNTIPGMTDHSLVPMAAAAAGIDFDELVVRILETSLCGEASG